MKDYVRTERGFYLAERRRGRKALPERNEGRQRPLSLFDGVLALEEERVEGGIGILLTVGTHGTEDVA